MKLNVNRKYGERSGSNIPEKSILEVYISQS